MKLREDCREEKTGNASSDCQTWSNDMACQEFRKEVDAVFPEHISRLNRGAADGTSVRRNQRRFLYREAQPSAGAIGRYRTQPVTFDEIKVYAFSFSSCFLLLLDVVDHRLVFVKPLIRHIV